MKRVNWGKFMVRAAGQLPACPSHPTTYLWTAGMMLWLSKSSQMRMWLCCWKSYNIVAVPETWWDEIYDWNVPINCYKLLRRYRRGRRGGSFAHCVKKLIMCEEMSQKNSQKQVETLEVKIRDLYSKFCSSMIVIYIFFKWLYRVQMVWLAQSIAKLSHD